MPFSLSHSFSLSISGRSTDITEILLTGTLALTQSINISKGTKIVEHTLFV